MEEAHRGETLALVGGAVLGVLDHACAGTAARLPAAWQAMDIVFEVLGADGDEVAAARGALGMCAALERAVPLLESKHASSAEAGGSHGEEEEEEIARAALENARGFIDYIKAE